MKPKIILTVASAMYLLLTFASFFMVGGEFNFLAYLGVGLIFSIAILFWSVRNAPPSQTLGAVLLLGFLTFFLGSLVAFYAQWSGNYADSPVGYLEGAAWLGMAVWFFLVRRANMSADAS
ncbi:MAG: hypothetical protein IT314_01510 [Anaerolineales bacterium]|nr:hypothetical protein [Anaerolineales bacterium]